MRDMLDQALSENGITLNEQAKEQMLRFLDLLTTWNKKFNLTSITNPRDMIYLHIIDSLLVAPFIHGKRCIDIGTGAGLPGIPLAIMHPDQEWTLLDKNNKKTRFQTQAIADLGLKNVKPVHSRAEDFHPEQCFDSILSRAYATLALFVKTSQHLLCNDGEFVAMKGKHPQTEVNGLPEHFDATTITQVAMKGMKLDRHIVQIKKK